MCWTSYTTPVKQIADDDIVCYKIFDKLNIRWDKNKIKELISLWAHYLYTPYSLNSKINIDYTWSDARYSWCINEGYHSFMTIEKANKCIVINGFFIIECIIPKNSFYYVNSREEIVSSNIIITDKIIK